MSHNQSNDSSIARGEIDRTIKSLQSELHKQLSAVRGKGIELRIYENGGKTHHGGGAAVSECTVVIQGDTVEDAYRLAGYYEDKGWTCASSGEKEVTCKSPD